jgi:hypothetical protein
MAAFTLVSGEALALSGLSVANTLVGALGISVVMAVNIGSVHPRELKGTDTIRAVTGVKIIVHAPVVVAEAKSTVANSMTTAGVVA